MIGATTETAPSRNDVKPAWKPTTVRMPTSGASSERALRPAGRVEHERERGGQQRRRATIEPKTTGNAPTRRTACASTGSGAPQPIAAARPKTIVSTPRGYGKRAPCVAPCCVAAS